MWRALSIALASLLLVILGATLWVFLTPTGTRWAARFAVAHVPALTIDRIDGTFARGVTVAGLSYAPAQGPLIKVEEARLQLVARDLVTGTVHLAQATADGVHVQLRKTPAASRDSQPSPFSLEPPVDLVIDRGVLRDAHVAAENGPLADIRRAEIRRGRWTGNGLALSALDVRAVQGAVRLSGNIAGGPQVYDADANGQWRWTLGATTYAGTVAMDTEQAQTRLKMALTAPVRAQLSLSIEQSARLPWRADVRVPPFDPRKQLLPTAPIAWLAADLQAKGTRREASVAGTITADDQVIHLEQARLLQRGPALVTLDPLVLRLGQQQGELRANGRLQLDAAPIAGALHARWDKVRVPETLAGQPLQTEGSMDVSGSTADYRASGAVALGPPGRLADIRFQLQGSPELLTLQQFDVVQQTGRLAATGTLHLSQPRTWDVEATARSFDPGEFLAGWPGDIDFTAHTTGSINDQGPRASLDLRHLRGSLRGRAIAGAGNIEYSQPLSLAGTLRLRSGQSRLRIDAAPGPRLDAKATFQIASLSDFLPAATGSVRGRVRGLGVWPDVAITGSVRGSDLRLAGTSIGSVDAHWQVRDPQAPAGNVSLHADRVAAAGIDFATVRLQAQGDAARHALSFEANGKPVAVAARVSGTLDEDKSWNGTVQRLRIELGDAAALQLRSPVAVGYDAGAVAIDDACLVNQSSRVCGSFSSESRGGLHATYDIEGLPLSLATVFFPEVLPGRLQGTLASAGSLRRTADGLWFGDASLSSAKARIHWATKGPEQLGGTSQTLYQQLTLDARLRGDEATVTLNSRLSDRGSLAGRVALADISGPAAAISGHVDASLPTIAPFAALVPQIAGLDGSVSAKIRVDGSVASPQLAGTLIASELAGEVPALGIRLANGTFQVDSTPRSEDLRLAGSVDSGKGRLKIQGRATRAGAIQATIVGQKFLAANLPGARVLASPDLRFARDAEGLSLTGTVHLPEAEVDLSKLPKIAPSGAHDISPDVIVVNESGARRAQDSGRAAMPLHAAVKLVLGEHVAVKGFGLDSTVRGQLTVREAPGRAATGSGEVQIDGTYKAYGQDLDITEGEVLFAGTPLDDPRLNIEAVRHVGDVTAGLRISGSAQNPQVNVFSDPALGQTDALAYLVTGRPLSAIGGASEGDASMLQQASQSLGTAAGGLLAKSIGKRLGIDEVGISTNEAIGGAALTVGQYLSPRVYVGLGIGLFDPGQVVTVRYKLSDALSLQAVTGPDTTQAGIDYRVER